VSRDTSDALACARTDAGSDVPHMSARMGQAGTVTRSASGPAPPRRRRLGSRPLPRWAGWLVVALLLVLLGVGAVVAWVAWGFAGGWDGIRPKAQPDDRAVVAARQAAHAPLDQLTAHVIAGLQRSAASGRLDTVEAARVRVDGCEEGQNNWKIHSGYTLRCEVTDVVSLGPAGASPPDRGQTPAPDMHIMPTALAATLDADIRRDGWSEAYVGSSLPEAIVRSSGASPEGHYRGTSSSLEGMGIRPRWSPGLEIGLYSKQPPDYRLPSAADTGLGRTQHIDGDLDAFLRAVADASSPQLVVRVTIEYFTD
jgi:hypothetical protein